MACFFGALNSRCTTCMWQTTGSSTHLRMAVGMFVVPFHSPARYCEQTGVYCLAGGCGRRQHRAGTDCPARVRVCWHRANTGFVPRFQSWLAGSTVPPHLRRPPCLLQWTYPWCALGIHLSKQMAYTSSSLSFTRSSLSWTAFPYIYTIVFGADGCHLELCEQIWKIAHVSKRCSPCTRVQPFNVRSSE